MKILFVRPPRLTWSHVDESSNNILPLAYPCLAAMVRRELPEVEIEILDCNVEEMGWRSLEQFIKAAAFDMVGVSSETVYVNADLQFLRWVRQHHPEASIVVGGRHYPFNAHDVFDENLADFIVRGEGEVTFVELLKQFMSVRPDYDSIEGLIWKDSNGQIHDTGWRDLIPHLDDLPLPAYDLVPVEKYTRNSAFWTNGITIFHGRGCDMGCSFCTFWPQDAKWKREEDGTWKAHPYYRTKSVERTMEEVELLINGYKKSLLFFIDGTFELDLEWTERFAEEVLRRQIRFTYWTFSRADTLLKCEEQGILEKAVRAGWRHMLIGAEHNETDALSYYRKPKETTERTVRIVDLLKRKYPEVIIHITFIGGYPDDTPKSLKSLYRYAINLQCDIASIHFLTPMPGTDLYERVKKEGLLRVTDFSQYNWFTPVMATKNMTLEQLDKFWAPKILLVNFHNPLRKIKRMFTGDPENRRIMRIGAMMAVRYVFNLVVMLFRKPGRKFRSFVTPEWYND